MIFIEDKNIAMENACNTKIIEETKTLAEDSDARAVPMDVKACDYDGVSLHFRAQGASPRKIEVAITSGSLEELMKFGGKELVDQEFGKYGAVYDEGTLTLKIDCDDLPEAPETVVSKLANLKRKVYGAPFDQCLIALAAGDDSLSPICYKYRKDSRIFLTPGKGHVAVVVQIIFNDLTDQELAKIVLQEFAEAQRAVSGSPAAFFKVDELPEAAKTAADACKEDLGPGDCTGFFLQLTINKSHVRSTEKRERITGLMINFRSYLLYHMKSTKAYLLSRMRTKHQDLIKALNRSRPMNKKDFGKKKRDI